MTSSDSWVHFEDKIKLCGVHLNNKNWLLTSFSTNKRSESWLCFGEPKKKQDLALEFIFKTMNCVESILITRSDSYFIFQNTIGGVYLHKQEVTLHFALVKKKNSSSTVKSFIFQKKWMHLHFTLLKKQSKALMDVGFVLLFLVYQSLSFMCYYISHNVSLYIFLCCIDI